MNTTPLYNIIQVPTAHPPIYFQLLRLLTYLNLNVLHQLFWLALLHPVLPRCMVCFVNADIGTIGGTAKRQSSSTHVRDF